jgi:hypothetical protein
VLVQADARHLPLPVEPTTLAYLAGVVDADGSISVRKSTYKMRVTGDAKQPVYFARVKVGQVEPQAVDLLKATFGGTVFQSAAHSRNGRPFHLWEIHSNKAAVALQAMLPYLRIKRAQAENAIRCAEVIGAARSRFGPRPVEASADLEECYQESRRLNRVGA